MISEFVFMNKDIQLLVETFEERLLASSLGKSGVGCYCQWHV